MKTKSKNLKRKAMALAICAVFLVAFNGIVLAIPNEKVIGLDNSAVLGDERPTYVSSVPFEEIGVKGGTETVTFPSSSDTYEVSFYPYWWHVGDKVYGDRTLTLNSINKVDMRLQITRNVLNNGGHCDMFLSINGVKVGEWQVLEGDTVISKTFTFSTISGPIYNIKIEETNLVEPGKGSCQLGPDVSTLTFYGAEEEPKVSVTTDKFEYCPCNTMEITIDVSNPTSSPVIFKWYFGSPTLGVWLPMYKGELPAGYQNTFVVKIHVDEWSKTPFSALWYVDLQDKETGKELAADCACWSYAYPYCPKCESETAETTPTQLQEIATGIGEQIGTM